MAHANPLVQVGRAVALFLLGSLVFTLAYTQAPLYYSNQNQYFLHGMADAGHGLLAEDWLAAETRDPTPVFSALVRVTARYMPLWVFFIYYGVILGAYAAAMVGVFVFLAREETVRRRWPVFVALLVLFHAGIVRWASYQWLGQDYAWYFQSGVAGQYLLGGMLQPSVFGVFLVVAVALFLRGRVFLAATSVALAGTVHSSTLLIGAMLTLGFMTALIIERRGRAALGMAGLTLFLVLPVTLHAISTFGPTTPEMFARAQDILVNFRIPHHSRPDLWFDLLAGLQIAWMGLGLVLVWRTRLFPVLAVPFALGAVLTLVQVATGSQTLALLFPWRVSALLMPLATTIVLTRLVASVPINLESTVARGGAVVLVVLLVAGGVWIMAAEQAYHADPEELAVMEYIQRSRQPGDLYLIPVRVPDLAATTRGSLSSDFKPLPAQRSDVRLIPVNLQRFRLIAGVPIVVDFKSIPYKDSDVLEWRERLRAVEQLGEQIENRQFSEVRTQLRAWGVTHVVWPAAQGWEAEGFEAVYEDPYYRVYRVEDAHSAP